MAASSNTLTRRSFVKGMFSSGLLTFTVAACSDDEAATFGSDGAGPTIEKWMGRQETQSLTAFVETALPQHPEQQLGVTPQQIAKRVAVSIFKSGPTIRFLLRASLKLLEYVPLFANLSFTRFSKMKAADRVQLVESWQGSGSRIKRLTIHGLRSVVMLNTYGIDQTWSVVGFEGPWIPAGQITPFEYPLGLGVTPENLADRMAAPDKTITWVKFVP